MAEFCVDCWNEINETTTPRIAFVLSWNRELCEGCNEYKRVIITMRRGYLLKEAIEELYYRLKENNK